MYLPHCQAVMNGVYEIKRTPFTFLKHIPGLNVHNIYQCMLFQGEKTDQSPVLRWLLLMLIAKQLLKYLKLVL